MYEERRLIRGQMRIAKRQGSRTTTPARSSFTPGKTTSTPSQPKRSAEPKTTTPKDSTKQPLSKCMSAALL